MRKKSGIVMAVIAVLVCCIGAFSLGYRNVKAENPANEITEYEIKSYITDKMKAEAYVSSADLCLLEEFTPQKLGQDADSIVLATVLTLDGADPSASIVGMTNGKMLVNQVLSGNLSQGQVINYSKPGGMMKMSEWEETQPEAATQKRQYLREQNNIQMDLNNTYIELRLSGDIEIEAGKSYLVYLKSNSTGYEIIGLGSGLRELNVPQKNTRIGVQTMDVNTLQIKNNETGEFESLQNYVNTYIGNGQESRE